MWDQTEPCSQDASYFFLGTYMAEVTLTSHSGDRDWENGLPGGFRPALPSLGGELYGGMG